MEFQLMPADEALEKASEEVSQTCKVQITLKKDSEDPTILVAEYKHLSGSSFILKD